MTENFKEEARKYAIHCTPVFFISWFRGFEVFGLFGRLSLRDSGRTSPPKCEAFWAAGLQKATVITILFHV